MTSESDTGPLAGAEKSTEFDSHPDSSALLPTMVRDRERWERIARHHPYYAVISVPQYFGSGTPAALHAFFHSGEAYVDGVLARVSDMMSDASIRSVLEFGCGPGRLACAFARRGFDVTAVDVSPTMLEIARRNCQARNVRKVDFQSVEEFLQREQTFDLVNATLVFQRIAPRFGIRVLEYLISRLAPGGYLHIQVPYRTDRTYLSTVLMAARRRSAIINRLVNIVRHRPADIDPLGVDVYSLDSIFALLSHSNLDVRTVDLATENELEVAMLVARRPLPRTRIRSIDPPPPEPTPGPEPGDLIDVRELIRATTIEDLNRKAEQYFASTTSFESQLAKPFGNFADAPLMLISLGVLMAGMRFTPGLVVLDFGAGTGWLSHRLAEMGCRMIISDVSPTALGVARRHSDEIGLMSKNPPQFLRFDGQRIDLANESVDRIICFDSFHHVPNPATVIREFGRILKSGGIAGFSEPGPEHSRSPQSQFEMRAYGVVENDVDINAVWDEARAAGFTDLALAAFNGDPIHLSLERFQELIRGGEALAETAHATRHFLENARVFFLKKAGTETIDSLRPEGLASEIEVELSESPRGGVPIRIRAHVTNTGVASWLPSGVSPGGVWLGCHLYSGGKLVQLDYTRQELSSDRNIGPGEKADVSFELPPVPAGEYELEFDCVAEGITWFAPRGSQTTRVHIDAKSD